MFTNLVRSTLVAVFLLAGGAHAQLEVVEPVCESVGGCGTCRADLGECTTTLESSEADRQACQSDLGDCTTRAESCESSLAACEACGDGAVGMGEECDGTELAGATCDGATGGSLPYGEIRCGSDCALDTSECTVRFVDTGLTIIDHKTGLEWEKKTDDGTVRDKDHTYRWTATGTAPDGEAFVVFLATLNECTAYSFGGGVTPGFAGHCDWRLPQGDELRSIRDCSQGPDCIDPIFGPAHTIPVVWSATHVSSLSHIHAQHVEFSATSSGAPHRKSLALSVRAVRTLTEK